MADSDKRAAELRDADPVGRMCVFNVTRQSFLSLGVKVLRPRFGPLSVWQGRGRLNWRHGLWLVPCRVVHTFGLAHPVDVVYLDAELRVLHVIEKLLPYRLARLRRATHSVLKLPERTLYWSNTAPGDQLLICLASDLAEQWARAEKERAVR